MTSAGANVTRLPNNPAHEGFPDWSPDGTKIAVDSDRTGNTDIWAMNTDGSGQVDLTNAASEDGLPNWSPDGKQIAFSSNRSGAGDIFEMNADGSSQIGVSSPFVQSYPEAWPSWSPDGISIAATFDPGNDNSIQVLPAGFSGSWNPVDSPPGSTRDDTPDWQPLTHSYVRPKGATPIRDALVPAYKACGSPNTTHQGSLSSGSCDPPSPASNYLTVGTPDQNGVAANSVGSVLMNVFCNGGAPGEQPPCSTTAGDQLDGKLTVSVTDVRCLGTGGGCSGGPLADYTDDLLFDANARVTDKNNVGLGGNATLSDFALRFSLPCASTVSTSVGSTCAATTSIDAVFGGSAIVEQKRAIWQLDQVELLDGGADGVASTQGDDTVFAVSGLFFP